MAAMVMQNLFFEVFVTDLMLQGQPEGLGQPVSVKSRLACASVCLHTSFCQGYFFVKEERTGVCTPAFQRYSAANGDNFTSYMGMRFYHRLIPNGRCPVANGYIWNEDVNLCYRFSQSEANYSSSSSNCTSEGARLVVLDTEAKYRAVRARILSFTVHTSRTYFIEGRRIPGQDAWQWPDKTEVTYKDWAYGEPNNLSEECLDLLSSKAFQWNDEYCSYLKYYICEKV